MAHHIFHTTAFVLSVHAVGERDVLCTLFTKEHGVLTAHARGVRQLSSKLRFSLVPYRLARIDLVRGKEWWKITSAHPEPTYAPVKSAARLASLLTRLGPGEAQDESLFTVVEQFLSGTETNEVRTIVRMLALLGYWEQDAIVSGDQEPDAKTIARIAKILRESGL